jgi:hypothetical protein
VGQDGDVRSGVLARDPRKLAPRDNAKKEFGMFSDEDSFDPLIAFFAVIP